jgi:hypothetical protein
MIRKAKNDLAVLCAGAAILIAGENVAYARYAGGSPHSTMPTPTGTAKAGANLHGGYGPGWCTWHPYACYRTGKNY